MCAVAQKDQLQKKSKEKNSSVSLDESSLFDDNLGVKSSSLTYNGDGTWISNEGLVYGQGSQEGNRVKHVMTHKVPNLEKPVHTVFNVEKSEVINLIDEGWLKKGSCVMQGNGNVVYDIDMGRSIGTNGENVLGIITEGYTNNIVSSFPKGVN